jgi:hypothetical protein
VRQQLKLIQQLIQQLERLLVNRRLGDDLRSRLDVRRAGVSAVGLIALRAYRELPGGRIGCGYHLA